MVIDPSPLGVIEVVYIPGTCERPLFWGLHPPNQGPNFKQNKGHQRVPGIYNTPFRGFPSLKRWDEFIPSRPPNLGIVKTRPQIATDGRDSLLFRPSHVFLL